MPIGIDPAQRRNLGLPPDPPAPTGGTLELLREKVRASALAGRVQFLPWLDRYTRETPQMRRFYRQLLKVPVVKAALYGKVFAAASLDLQLHPEQDTDRDNRIADATRDGILACKGGLRKIAETTLAPALIDGHSVAEKGVEVMERGRWKGLYGYKHLKGKDTDEGPSVKLVTDEYLNVIGVRAYGYGQAQVHDPRDFVILSYMSLFESPAGISDMRAVYAPFWRLDTAEKLRAIHLEKYTSPLLKGVYSDPETKPALDAALAQAAGGTWFSVPDDVAIEAMQIATRGEAEFQAAVADYKEDIALAVAGAFLQMLTSRGGGGDMRGDAVTQKGTADLFVWYLATVLGELITDQMVPDLVDLNWAGAGYPKATLGGVNDAELLRTAQLHKLLQEMGYPLSLSAGARYFGVQLATDPADALKPLPAGPAPQAGGGLPFSTGGKQGLPFAETQGGEGIALPGREGARAGELLREAQAHGQRVLLDVLRPAVTRLLESGGQGAELFAPGDRQQLAEALAGTLAAADLLGRSRLRELVRLDGNHFSEGGRVAAFAEFAEPIPVLSPEAALDYFRGLVPTLGVDPGRYGDGMRRRAFTLAAATEETLLEKVQRLIVGVLESGQVTDAEAQVQAVLDGAGVTPQNPGYAELVFRTNMADALNQGAWDEYQSPDVVDEFPAWRYSAVADSRSRPHHAAKNGKVYPNAKSFNEVRGTDAGDVCNCRCTFIPLHKSELSVGR